MHDKRLLERIFKAHYPKMLRIAKMLLYNDKEAEDVVFDVFAKMWERDVDFSAGKTEAYLAMAVRNGCFNIIKKQKLRERIQKLYPLEDEMVDDDEIDRAEKIAEYIETKIQEPEKSILKLRFVDDLTFKEIALRLEMNINTVYKYLTVSIDKIKKHFKIN
jgi:RNA polymerase sigma factor (sigma-70 family)